jgi:farnesyl diphosphate synthase
MDAVNDALILESFIYFMLRRYLRADAALYVSLLELYHEVSLQTQLGQMLDTTASPQGQKSPALLAKFSLELHRLIVQYKTAFYTFYLPIASAMMLCGLGSAAELGAARRISLELGEKFQIEDDYLDCFQDPKVLGKVGTDITDFKCSWLVAKALLLCSPQQRRVLEECYGSAEEAKIERVKQLYRELGLPAVYEEQERASLARCERLIDDAAPMIPKGVFLPILKKIHMRQK